MQRDFPPRGKKARQQETHHLCDGYARMSAHWSVSGRTAMHPSSLISEMSRFCGGSLLDTQMGRRTSRSSRMSTSSSSILMTRRRTTTSSTHLLRSSSDLSQQTGHYFRLRREIEPSYDLYVVAFSNTVLSGTGVEGGFRFAEVPLVRSSHEREANLSLLGRDP